MFELAGKTVFITGGGGGIGGGMAQAFAERGARIVLADIERGFAEQEAARLPAEAASKVIELDVCDMASWESARQRSDQSMCCATTPASRPASSP